MPADAQSCHGVLAEEVVMALRTEWVWFDYATRLNREGFQESMDSLETGHMILCDQGEGRETYGGHKYFRI